MYYYFSIILAISLSILNSPKLNLYTGLSNLQTLDKAQPVAQATSTDVDSFLVEQPEDNSLESSTDSPTGNSNKNLSLILIAVTSIFTATLLLLLWQKEPINLSDPKSEEEEEKNISDDKNRLEIPEPSKNGSKSNSAPQQQDPQEQDTVVLPPHINYAKTDVVTQLILKLQSKDPQIRQKLIGQLGQCGDSRAMKPLVKLISEVDSQERTLILEAMSQINSSMLKSMNQLLLLSLGDENSQINLNAIRDLTRIYEVMTQVTERLAQTINNTEQELPETAQWALKELKQIPETPTWQLTELINN